jgi:hypothetical protein
MTWLVPLVVSGIMYDPATKEFLPNLVVFKPVMIAILIAVTVPGNIWLAPSLRTVAGTWPSYFFGTSGVGLCLI